MSDKIKDGGPAFPVSSDDFRDLENHPCKGMSLRDWFAGMALQGLCSNEVITRPRPQTKEFIEFAKVCYDYADGMLAQREKGVKP